MDSTRLRAILIAGGYLGVAWYDELNAANLTWNPTVPWWILYLFLAIAGFTYRWNNSRWWQTAEVAVLAMTMLIRGLVYGLNHNWNIVALSVVYLTFVYESWTREPTYCEQHNDVLRDMNRRLKQADGTEQDG